MDCLFNLLRRRSTAFSLQLLVCKIIRGLGGVPFGRMVRRPGQAGPGGYHYRAQFTPLNIKRLVPGSSIMSIYSVIIRI